MKKATEHKFNANIYKVGINACVDVPEEITEKMKAENGYIKISGRINGFAFNKNLVPVKNKPYRLFVKHPDAERRKSQFERNR